MPNYDYKCLECGHCFQKLLPAGTEETKCLECGHPAQKQLSAPQVHFIGGGFYKTDSRPKENKKEDSPKKESPKKPDPKKKD